MKVFIEFTSSFGMIQIGISDPRSLGSWYIKKKKKKGTEGKGIQSGFIGSFNAL